VHIRDTEQKVNNNTEIVVHNAALSGRFSFCWLQPWTPRSFCLRTRRTPTYTEYFLIHMYVTVSSFTSRRTLTMRVRAVHTTSVRNTPHAQIEHVSVCAKFSMHATLGSPQHSLPSVFACYCGVLRTVSECCVHLRTRACHCVSAPHSVWMGPIRL